MSKAKNKKGIMDLSTKKILIIAYACEPNRTSEPGVGWNFSKEMSKYSKITVLTRLNNKIHIDNYQCKNMTFIYYDLPSFFLFFKKRIPFGTQFYYLFWQLGAYFKIKGHTKKSKYDLLHHLNFSINWNPPPFFLVNIPYVWGPVGGADIVPFKFIKYMGISAFVNEKIFYLINLYRKFIFNLISRKENPNTLVLRTNSALKIFRKRSFKNIFVVSETASEEIKSLSYSFKKFNGEINAICIGRMNYWKGFFSAVKGFHLFVKNGGVGKLELYGDGPDLKKIKIYIKENNLNNRILIKGFVNNSQIKSVLLKSNILIHPSFRDGGSWSIMEAMSYGLPVICLDTSGPKDMVTKDCGILIKPKNKNQVINDIGNALTKLQKDPDLYDIYSKNAFDRISKEYCWSRRGEQMKEAYLYTLKSSS